MLFPPGGGMVARFLHYRKIRSLTLIHVELGLPGGRGEEGVELVDSLYPRSPSLFRLFKLFIGGRMKHTDRFRRKQLYRKLMAIIRDEYETRKQLSLFNNCKMEFIVREIPAGQSPDATPSPPKLH